MATTTVIEKLPMNWDKDFDGDWDGDPCAAWRKAFENYVSENYPPCSVVGDEIYGPATYRFPHCGMQAGTTPVEDLIELPDGGIYAEFQELHRDDWSDVIEDNI